MASSQNGLMSNDSTPAAALVDGNKAPALACPVEAVIGGDGLGLSIAAASVVAKVTHDRFGQIHLHAAGENW